MWPLNFGQSSLAIVQEPAGRSLVRELWQGFDRRGSAVSQAELGESDRIVVLMATI